MAVATTLAQCSRTSRTEHRVHGRRQPNTLSRLVCVFFRSFFPSFSLCRKCMFATISPEWMQYYFTSTSCLRYLPMLYRVACTCFKCYSLACSNGSKATKPRTISFRVWLRIAKGLCAYYAYRRECIESLCIGIFDSTKLIRSFAFLSLTFCVCTVESAA